MSSRQILQVITRSEWGGAQQIVASLAKEIDAVTTVACGPGGRLINTLETANIDVRIQQHLQSSPYPTDVLAYQNLQRLLAEGTFDLVHSHSTKAGALARLAAVRAGVPSVFTVHGWGFYNTAYSGLRPLLIMGERALARQTDRIVCVSENDRHEGLRHDILDGNRETVIYNGIAPIQRSPDHPKMTTEFGIGEEKPILGAIARLAPQKNPLRILETACQLADRGYEFATVLLGSGPLLADCREFVQRHRMTDVYIPGYYDGAQTVLHEFDLFLLPSRFEGFPLTVLECLHAGVPVVAHDVGGITEAIDDGVTGAIVDPNATCEEFATRVRQLLDDPQRRAAMGTRGKQVASARFTEQRMIEQYRQLYETLLS